MQTMTPTRKLSLRSNFAKGTKRNIALTCFLGLLALLIYSWNSAPSVAAKDGRQMTGIFSITWVDPEPGSGVEAREDYSLIGDDGTTTRLGISPKVIEEAGGPIALLGKKVKLDGVPAEGKKALTEFDVATITINNAPSVESTPSGNLKYLTILCRFSDFSTYTPNPPSYYSNLVGATYPGLDHYWQEVSYGTINITGSAVAGWYDLPNPKSYYQLSGGGFDYILFSQECGALADPTVYFPDYHGVMFASNSEFSGAFPGAGSPYLSLSFDGGPRNYAGVWGPPAVFARQTIVAHEMGHSFGLPHSSGGHGSWDYDSQWDVMSSVATLVVDPTYSNIAPHTISSYKDRLGWIPSNRVYSAPVSGANTINLTKLNIAPLGSNRYLIAKVPIAGSFDNYYSVELRDLYGYDQSVPAKAVVIHKVVAGNATVIDSDGNTNPNDAGAQWVPGETFTSTTDRVSIAINYELSGLFNITIEANYGCTFSLSSGSASYGTFGGHGSFNVNTQSGCYWTMSGANPVYGFQGDGFDVNDAPVTSPYIGVAATYPSTATVSGVSGNVTKVAVTLNSIEHPSPGDLDILLVGPNSSTVMLMSDISSSSMNRVELVFDSFASSALKQTGSNAAGMYLPTDYGFGDTFPSPGPGYGFFGTDLDVFNGINPNGDWKIYAVDDTNGNSGRLTRIWSIDIHTGAVTSTNPFSNVGPQTVNYTVTRNYGSSRTTNLTAAGYTFTISQS